MGGFTSKTFAVGFAVLVVMSMVSVGAVALGTPTETEQFGDRTVTVEGLEATPADDGDNVTTLADVAAALDDRDAAVETEVDESAGGPTVLDDVQTVLTAAERYAERNALTGDAGASMIVDDAVVTNDSPAGNTSVHATADEPLTAFQTFVDFDPDAVSITGVEDADFEDLSYEYDNDEGWLRIAGDASAGIEDPTLATVEFDTTMESYETTALSLTEDSYVVDEDGDRLAPTRWDGTITKLETLEPTMLIQDVTVEPDEPAGETSLLSFAPDPVAGFQAFVEFDPDVLTVESVEGGALEEVTYDVDNDDGWLNLAGAQAVGEAHPALATIAFNTTLEENESTTLSLAENSVVNDDHGAKLDSTLVDGTITSFEPVPEEDPAEDPGDTTTPTTPSDDPDLLKDIRDALGVDHNDEILPAIAQIQDDNAALAAQIAQLEDERAQLQSIIDDTNASLEALQAQLDEMDDTPDDTEDGITGFGVVTVIVALTAVAFLAIRRLD